MDKQNIKVTIFGKKYVISAIEQSDQVVKAAQMVDSMMQNVAENSSHIQEAKAAVLVSLQLAADLIKLRDEQQAKSEKINHLTQSLSSSEFGGAE